MVLTIIWLYNVDSLFTIKTILASLFAMYNLSHMCVCSCRGSLCASSLKVNLCPLHSPLSPVKGSPVPAQKYLVMRSHHPLYLLPALALWGHPEGPQPLIQKTFPHSVSTSCLVTLLSGMCRRCLSLSTLCQVSDLQMDITS